MPGDTKDRGIRLLNFIDSKMLVLGLIVGSFWAARLYDRFETTERTTDSNSKVMANLVEVSAGLKTSTESLRASTEGLERRVTLLEARPPSKSGTP